MMNRLRKFTHDERGSSIVELGLVTPIFAMMLIGMIDISRAYTHRLQLEQAAQRTIEEVMQQPEALTDYTNVLKAEGAAAAGVPESAVTPAFWLECDGTAQGAGTFTSSCPSGTTYYARYVSVAIDKPYDPTFRTSWFPGANADGTVTLTGRAGVRVQ